METFQCWHDARANCHFSSADASVLLCLPSRLHVTQTLRQHCCTKPFRSHLLGNNITQSGRQESKRCVFHNTPRIMPGKLCINVNLTNWNHWLQMRQKWTNEFCQFAAFCCRLRAWDCGYKFKFPIKRIPDRGWDFCPLINTDTNVVLFNTMQLASHRKRVYVIEFVLLGETSERINSGFQL